MRAPLGIKRTVETGKVKQSFSHGRSNTVVVEVKKRRILGRPGEDAAPAPEAEAQVEVAAPVVEAAPAPLAPPPPPAPRAMTPLERREQQERLLREAEEARMTALEENRRREDRSKVEQSEEEKRRAEENRKAEEARAAEPAPEPEVAAEPEAAPRAAAAVCRSRNVHASSAPTLPQCAVPNRRAVHRPAASAEMIAVRRASSPSRAP